METLSAAPEVGQKTESYTRTVKAVLLNRILLVLAFVGLFIAGVLSMERILGVVAPCGISSGCEKVSHSAQSMLGPIYVGYIGFLGYAALAALAIYRSMKGLRATQSLVTVGFVFAAVGTIFSLYLQYVSYFEIHAVCPWCLSSAITMIVTLIVYALLAQAMENSAELPTEAQGADKKLFVALPVVCAIALIGVNIASNSSSALPTIALPQDATTDLLPADAPVFGQPNAPITIVEFADMSCPSCQDAFPRLKEFAQSYPDKVRIVFRNFPLDKHQFSRVSAAMGEYAQEKGRFWDFTTSVMGLNREPQNVDELFGIAGRVGLDVNDLKRRLSNPSDTVYKLVARDLNDGNKLGIKFTPTSFVMAKGLPTQVETGHDAIDLIEGPKYHKILHG